MQEVPDSTKDGLKTIFHPLLSSYSIPENDDFLGLKQCSRTIMPCYLCISQKELLPLSTNAGKQSSNHPNRIMDKMHAAKLRHEAEVELRYFSMYAFLPILNAFPSLEIHPCVDFYAIFLPEPLPAFCH